MEREVGYVFLPRQGVLFQFIGLMTVIGDEKGIVIRTVLNLAQGGNHFRLIAVANVILLAVGNPCAVAFGRECC